jgi:hypothetical protein
VKALGAVLLVVAELGCTSVKMVQREGCWVRREEKAFGRVREEVGPCARPTSPWVEDRLTRLVQECIAREDYRWQTRAVAAWTRREAWPAQDPEASVLQACMNQAAHAAVTDVEALNERLATAKDRLGEVSSDREKLRARLDDDRAHLAATTDKLAEYLGEAAKKPLPPATATATASSDGRAHTESLTPETAPVAITNAPSATAGATMPAATPATLTTPVSATAPACAPATSSSPKARARAGKTQASRARPVCDPAPAAPALGAPAATAHAPALPTARPAAGAPATDVLNTAADEKATGDAGLGSGR